MIGHGSDRAPGAGVIPPCAIEASEHDAAGQHLDFELANSLEVGVGYSIRYRRPTSQPMLRADFRERTFMAEVRVDLMRLVVLIIRTAAWHAVLKGASSLTTE